MPKKQINNVKKTCGNCKYIQYSSAQEIAMEYGTCKKVQRSTAFSGVDGCDCWKEKSYVTTLANRKRAETLTKLVSEINYNTQHIVGLQKRLIKETSEN